MTSPTDKPNVGSEFEQDFEMNGYLADSMIAMRSQLERDYETEFELAGAFNRLAQRFYVSSTHLLKGLHSHDALALGLQVMPRVLSSYQGAILMAKQGMHIESLSLTRSVTEAAFWIGYLHESPTIAVADLFSESLRQELEMHRLSLAAISDSEKLVIETRLRMQELGNLYKAKKRAPISIEAIAKASGFHDRYPEYRYLCGEATHTNLRSILHYITIDNEGTFEGHTIGPNEAETPRAVLVACSSLMIAIEAYRRLTKLSVFDEQFSDLIKRLEPLIQVHP